MTGAAAGRRRGDADRRRLNRIAAIQTLYQVELTGTAPELAVRDFGKIAAVDDGDVVDTSTADPAGVEAIVLGVSQHSREIDALIEATLAAGWAPERLEVVLRQILRAAVYELIARADVPALVVVSEYVAITDAFFAGQEPGFVNGVLNRLARQLRPSAFADEVAADGSSSRP
jgi:N utilization substance protein B